MRVLRFGTALHACVTSSYHRAHTYIHACGEWIVLCTPTTITHTYIYIYEPPNEQLHAREPDIHILTLNSNTGLDYSRALMYVCASRFSQTLRGRYHSGRRHHQSAT